MKSCDVIISNYTLENKYSIDVILNHSHSFDVTLPINSYSNLVYINYLYPLTLLYQIDDLTLAELDDLTLRYVDYVLDE